MPDTQPALEPQPGRHSDEDVVISLYEAVLRRNPDPGGLAGHMANLRRHGLTWVARSILDSDEALQLAGLGDRIHLGLAGNCNMPPVAACLATCAKILPRWVADVNVRHWPAYDGALEAIERHRLDFIVTQPIRGYEEVATTRLQSLYGERCIVITNIHFTGLHPDLIADRQTPLLQSPLGECHSRIVLACFLRRMSRADCAARFTAETYDRLGYFSAFERSAADLRAREQSVTLRFADRFLDMARNVLPLYTINHPTSPVFAALCEQIAPRIGAGEQRFGPDCFVNELADSSIWPIYPELREALRLRYETGFTFRAPKSHGSQTLGLEAFIAGCYECYDRVSLADILSTHAGLADCEL